VQQTAVRHLVRERVLEPVFELRPDARFIDELSRLKRGAVGTDEGFGLTGDLPQQDERHIPADDGGRLEERLLFRG
jgi:hypothetical protein